MQIDLSHVVQAKVGSISKAAYRWCAYQHGAFLRRDHRAAPLRVKQVLADPVRRDLSS